MKRKPTIILLIILIALASVCCRLSPAKDSASVTDVSGYWAYPHIKSLLEKGIIIGYGDGTFRPEQSISRAEFVTMINRAFYFNTAASISYKDVLPWAWYYDDIGRAVEAGYLPEAFGNRLLPNQYLTREEAAYMLAVVLKMDMFQRSSLPFIDAYSVSSFYRNAVMAMVRSGFMSGYPEGVLRPQQPISRAESAVLISNALQLHSMPHGGYDVKDYGAKGNGVNDDTLAIQRTIDEAYANGGGTVYVPAGTYMVNIDGYTAINVKSNIKMVMTDNTTLKAIVPMNGVIPPNHAILRIRDASQVEIKGGRIIGCKKYYDGKYGESGHGISVQGSNNVHIQNIYSAWNWGDGIFVGNSTSRDYSENVLIEDFICEYNNRQGISVVSAKNLTIRRGTCRYTYGSNPQSGIDLEPFSSEHAYLDNVLVENVYCHHNGTKWEKNYCWGICIALGHYENNAHPFSVIVKDCRLVDNGRGRDNEQMNYGLIEYYLSSPNWHGTIKYSDISYK